MPQRFEGLTTLAMARARQAQDAFDAANPYPPGVQAWQRERQALQQAGALPPGPEQCRPAYAHVYLDDGAGAALNDSVPVPPELAHIELGELATRTLGGVPSAADSRAAVHLRIAIAEFERLGFRHEASKTECGSAIVNLGFRVRADAGRIDCPLPKRRILLRDVRELRRAATAGEPLQQRSVERLTGRLAHLSHALPELAPHLAGGYAIAAARLQRAGRRHRSRIGEVRLRRGGRCEAAVRTMCDVAEQLLEANDGIALASAAAFAPLGAPGSLVTVTDASGDDGVGGYAFTPSDPAGVWLLSEEWPADVRAALAFAAEPRAERLSDQGATACSMPLAELFGPWALASAVADQLQGASGGRPGPAAFTAVHSVVDCAPAAAVLTAATSAGAQLRSLVAAARADVRQWLAVSVPREWNTDADTLSHPAQWEEVRAAAEAAGLVVRGVLRVPDRCWAALRVAMALPMGREAAAWREAGEAPPPPAPEARWGSVEAVEAAALLRDTSSDARLAARRSAVMGRAASSGLLDVHARPTDVFVGDPSVSELRALQELRAASHQIVHEAVDPGRLQSAISHWELWRQEAPARVPFLPLFGAGSPGADEAMRYNSETMELFTASCLRRGSLRPGHLGEPLETDTISGYVSALRALLSRDCGVQMRSAQHDVRVRALNCGIRRARPPKAPRKRRRGLRARQLRAAAANPRFDRTRSWAARRRWAMIVTGHSLIARGGELGRVTGKQFSAQRGLTWAHVQWHAVGALHPTHAAVTIHLCSVKDSKGQLPRVPIPIRRRAPGTSRADDPLCVYDLLAALWEVDRRMLGEAAALAAPIFRTATRGSASHAVSTHDVRRAVREVAEAAGEPPDDFGAHSLRVGGASDVKDLFDCSSAGLEEAVRVLKKRGRWRSDIAFIYTRASLSTSLEASARLASVDGRDIEAAFSAWAEPA